MATQVNLFNHEWCEMVFVNRNHVYGAFEIRQTNAKRHMVAIVIALSLTSLIIAMPSILKREKNIILKPVDRTHEFTEFKNEKPLEEIHEIVKPKEEIMKDFRSMINGAVPEIVEDDLVTDENLMATNDSLYDSDADIGNKTKEGKSDSKNSYFDIIPNENTQEIVDYVPQMPQYPGGQEALFKYLKKNLSYPPVPRDNGVQGTVYIQFVVFASGEIGNIEIARGFDVDCENEAIRVIKKMGNWLPGKQNGNAVNVRMSIPVKFRLNE